MGLVAGLRQRRDKERNARTEKQIARSSRDNLVKENS
jgi:hypothetical protein